MADAIVHELRQPLTSIVFTAQAAVRLLDEAEKAGHAAEIRGLLNEIIAISKAAGADMRRAAAGSDERRTRRSFFAPRDEPSA